MGHSRVSRVLGIHLTLKMTAENCNDTTSKYNFCHMENDLCSFTVAQWLRCCATNRKVAGSILAGVNFH